MCDEWKNDFLSFYSWSIKNGYKEGLTIDRIDNNGNYEPCNCRWVTAKEQARNRRTNIFVKFNGEKICLKDFCNITGMKYKLIWERMYRYGKSFEEATGVATKEDYAEVLSKREEARELIRSLEND